MTMSQLTRLGFMLVLVAALCLLWRLSGTAAIVFGLAGYAVLCLGLARSVWRLLTWRPPEE